MGVHAAIGVLCCRLQAAAHTLWMGAAAAVFYSQEKSGFSDSQNEISTENNINAHVSSFISMFPRRTWYDGTTGT